MKVSKPFRSLIFGFILGTVFGYSLAELLNAKIIVVEYAWLF